MSSSSIAGAAGAEETRPGQQRPSWAELIAFVRHCRVLSSSDTSSVAHNFCFSNPAPDGSVTLYALGKPVVTQRDHTLVFVDLPPPALAETAKAGDGTAGPTTLFWNELIVPHEELVLSDRLSKQEELLQERKRHRCYGVTAYDFHAASRSFVFTAGGSLFGFIDDKERRAQATITRYKLGENVKSPLNVTFCPADPRLIAFVADADIYLLFDGVSKRATFTCSKSKKFAGVPAYVYQEEFDRFDGYWWQPASARHDGKQYLLYEETDESEVQEISICVPATHTDAVEVMRYPKAGSKNAKSVLKLLEINVGASNADAKTFSIVERSMKVDLNSLFPWAEYLVRAGWVETSWHPEGKAIWVELMSRAQDHIAIVLVSLDFFVPADDVVSLREYLASNNGASHRCDFAPVVVLYEETNELFVQCHDHFKFLSSDTPSSSQLLSFLWCSEMTGYAHLYRITSDVQSLRSVSMCQRDRCVESPYVAYASVREVTALTEGQWAVSKHTSSRVDEQKGLVFFVGSMESPIEQHAYVTSYRGTNRTCRRLTKLGSSHCVDGGQHMWMSPCRTLMLDIRSSFLEPSQCGILRIVATNGADAMLPSSLALLSIASASSNSARLLDDVDVGGDEDDVTQNEEMLTDSIVTELSVRASSSCVPRLFTYQSANSGQTHYGLLFLPENSQPGVRLPTILYVYGGPNVQMVKNVYYGNRLGFQDFLHFGYCVLMVDGRGSCGRGIQFEGALKYKMGTVEVDDQVEGLLHCANKETDLIDLSRVCVFGWSYGGYLALMLLCRWPKLFKCSIAGAPVTTWNLYDTGYTERYMGLPTTNDADYAASSILANVRGFPDEPNRLLILHGLNDENVHFSHTAQLVSAFIRAGKPYSLQIYPNERHAARRGDSSEHMDTTILQFLSDNL